MGNAPISNVQKKAPEARSRGADRSTGRPIFLGRSAVGLPQSLLHISSSRSRRLRTR